MPDMKNNKISFGKKKKYIYILVANGLLKFDVVFLHDNAHPHSA